MPNLHQMGSALLEATRPAKGYRFQIERAGRVYSDIHLGSVSPSEGLVSVGDVVAVAQYEKTVFMDRSAWCRLDPPEPREGDRLVDLDHDKQRWRIVPTTNGRAFRYHGTNETSYALAVKLEKSNNRLTT